MISQGVRHLRRWRRTKHSRVVLRRLARSPAPRPGQPFRLGLWFGWYLWHVMFLQEGTAGYKCWLPTQRRRCKVAHGQDLRAETWCRILYLLMDYHEVPFAKAAPLPPSGTCRASSATVCLPLFCAWGMAQPHFGYRVPPSKPGSLSNGSAVRTNALHSQLPSSPASRTLLQLVLTTTGGRVCGLCTSWTARHLALAYGPLHR